MHDGSLLPRDLGVNRRLARRNEGGQEMGPAGGHVLGKVWLGLLVFAGVLGIDVASVALNGGTWISAVLLLPVALCLAVVAVSLREELQLMRLDRCGGCRFWLREPGREGYGRCQVLTDVVESEGGNRTREDRSCSEWASLNR